MIRQNDDRLAAGCEIEDRGRWGGRVDKEQSLAVVDRVGRDLGAPIAARGVILDGPVWMPRLPPPQTRLQLTHGSSAVGFLLQLLHA
jgi:hypothetical protein